MLGATVKNFVAQVTRCLEFSHLWPTTIWWCMDGAADGTSKCTI